MMCTPFNTPHAPLQMSNENVPCPPSRGSGRITTNDWVTSVATPGIISPGWRPGAGAALGLLASAGGGEVLAMLNGGDREVLFQLPPPEPGWCAARTPIPTDASTAR